MAYHVRLDEQGAVALPEMLIDALGVRRGELQRIERSGDCIVLLRDEQPNTPLGRLRAVLADYGAEQFLADRPSGWAE